MVTETPITPLHAGSRARIVARDLSYGPLSGVNFAAHSGAVCALLGKNGAGKSTLLRLLAGLAAPAIGAVDVDAPLGYAPQDYRASLFPWLSVADNIGLLLRGVDISAEHRNRRVRTAAQAVGLRESLLTHRPAHLSGGEQQLLCLARALVVNPRALLLDEPFAALDIVARVRARRAVANYAETARAAVVLITHDLDDVTDIAHRAVVVATGDPWVVTDIEVHGNSPDRLRPSLLRACEEKSPEISAPVHSRRTVAP